MIAFIHPVQFDSNDIQNLLSPQYFYVGAMYDGDKDKLPDFIQRGVWENGYNTEIPRLTDRVKKMRKGDFIIVKRLMGKGTKTMRILAVGIVVGLSLDGTYVLVSWAMPEVNIEIEGTSGDEDVIVPLREISTVSAPQGVVHLDPKLQNLVDKCRVRFLRHNLDVKPRHYL